MDAPQPIRVAALGGESRLSQIDRIRQGLAIQPGVEVIEDPQYADLIYANDEGHHARALWYRERTAERHTGAAKVILNVLDIPAQLFPPNGDYTFEKLAVLGANLKRADAITAISAFTAGQIQHYLGLGSTIIYNPVKDVSPAKRLAGERPYPFRVLLAGRCCDKNKRQDTIGIPALITAGFNENEVAIVGGEYPGWGTDLGLVCNDTLNDLLNSVDFVMQPTLLGGWELLVSEAMICGAIPIVCHDLTTVSEMPIPRSWQCYPSVTTVAYRLRVLIENHHLLEAEREHCLALSEGLQEQLGKEAVARRILNLYRKIAPSSPPDLPHLSEGSD